jgi:hypothetical protein
MTKRKLTGTAILSGLALVLVALVTLAIWYNTRPPLGLDRADDMGITLVWTSDERNCGADASSHGLGGCYNHAEPTVIYISEGMGYDATSHIILHELAHVQQFRDSPRGRTNECEADQLAYQWGSPLAPDNTCGVVD